jgi:hypothetical protein
MTKLLTILIISICFTLYGVEEVKASPVVQAILDKATLQISKNKVAYDTANTKPLAEVEKSLKLLIATKTKTGDLNGALAIQKILDNSQQNLIAEVEKKINNTDLLGNEKNEIDISKIITSGSIWQYNRADGEYIRLNKGGSVNIWWANKIFSSKNPCDSAGTWQKLNNTIVIIFEGRNWTIKVVKSEEVNGTDSNGGNFLLKKIE